MSAAIFGKFLASDRKCSAAATTWPAKSSNRSKKTVSFGKRLNMMRQSLFAACEDCVKSGAPATASHCASGRLDLRWLDDLNRLALRRQFASRRDESDLRQFGNGLPQRL